MASPVDTSAQDSTKRPALNTNTSAPIDPFASQRNDSVGQNGGDKSASATTASSSAATPTKDAGSPVEDRRLVADEWDGSKTPPSRFQKHQGSVSTTQSSRDSHIDSHKERDSKFHEVAATMTGGVVFGNLRKRSSKGSEAEKEDGGKFEEK